MNETCKTIINRTSTRAFKKEQVTDEEIKMIVDAGLYAPSGRGLQTPVIVVITNDALKEEIRRLNASIIGNETIDPFYGAPVIILVLAKKEGTFVYDGSCTLMNMMIAAESLNIGSCWIHRAKEEMDSPFGKELLTKLGLSGEYVGIGHLAIGYKEKETPLKPRKENRVFYLK